MVEQNCTGALWGCRVRVNGGRWQGLAERGHGGRSRPEACSFYDSAAPCCRQASCIMCPLCSLDPPPIHPPTKATHTRLPTHLGEGKGDVGGRASAGDDGPLQGAHHKHQGLAGHRHLHGVRVGMGVCVWKGEERSAGGAPGWCGQGWHAPWWQAARASAAPQGSRQDPPPFPCPAPGRDSGIHELAGQTASQPGQPVRS